MDEKRSERIERELEQQEEALAAEADKMEEKAAEVGEEIDTARDKAKELEHDTPLGGSSAGD